MIRIAQLLSPRENTNPLRDLNSKNFAAGIVAALIGITGPTVLALQAAVNGNFTTDQTIIWILSVYVLGGLFSIIIPLHYRLPVAGAHTLTGIAFLTTVTPHISYSQLIGAYIGSSLIMLFIGYFGAFSKLMAYIPKEIIAAMLAGMITKYMVNFIGAFNQLPLIAMGSITVFFIFTKLNNRVPPILASLVTGFILLFFTQPFVSGGLQANFVVPTIQIPQFSLVTIITVSLPLALLILSNDAAVGLSALEQNDFRPPVNALIFYSGVFSIIANFFGGQSANVAGMMSAICSDEQGGPKEKRYMAAVVSGATLVVFGVFSWKLVPFIQGLPQPFVAILVGIALLGVFGNSLHIAFAKPTMKMGAAVTFMVAMSSITLFNISAPVWSLIAGTLIAKYIK